MSHYYSENQDSILKLHDIEISIKGLNFTIKGASGVFSAKKLDNGTELLLNGMHVGDRVLDLGCGCGIVGLTVKMQNKEIEVLMSDINKRAVKISKMNAKALGLDVKVVHSDKYAKIEGKFDTILLNPPQTAGKDVCFDMIAGAKDFLVDGGSLQIVARHNKGGKHLSEKMVEIFGNVEVLGRKGGFRVYCSTL